LGFDTHSPLRRETSSEDAASNSRVSGFVQSLPSQKPWPLVIDGATEPPFWIVQQVTIIRGR
jgi:hypothetical protein